MSIRREILAYTTIIFLSACGSSGGTPAVGGAHLQFASTTPVAATSAPRSASRQAPAPAPATVDFDLGDIPSTTKFFFLLQNTGNTDATNVALTTDNPNVIVRPALISVVHPVKAGGITPLIQVEILHGFGSSGLGEHAILDPGNLSFTVTATSDQDTMHASMSSNVLVANYTVNQPSSAEVYIQENLNAAIGEEGFLPSMLEYYRSEIVTELPDHNLIPINGYNCEDQSSSTWTITNTGNCPIWVLPRFDPWNRAGIIPGFTLPAGQTAPIPYEVSGDTQFEFNRVVIEVRAGSMFSQSLSLPWRIGAHAVWHWLTYTLPASG